MRTRIRYISALALLSVACQGRYVIGSERGASGGGTSSTSGDATSGEAGAATNADADSTTTTTLESTGHGSNASSSSTTETHCAAVLGDSSCELCLADTCCALAASCVDDPTCACMLACRLDGHSWQACDSDCGGAAEHSHDLHDCSFNACGGCF